MITTRQAAEATGVTWVDVQSPTLAQLQEVAAQYRLHETTVQDCLDPEHLPKFERIEDATFLILRAYEPDRPGLVIQDMTRKIAVFTRGDLVLTVHRRTSGVLTRVAESHGKEHGESRCSPTCLVVAMIHEVLDSFERPLEEAEATIDQFEAALFDDGRPNPALKAIHLLKGRVGLIRRLLWQTVGVVGKFAGHQERATPLFQDLHEAADGYHFYSDRLLESANSLLATYLAMASFRTNEVVRVLTVFSAFFLPLTFIVGIYGMNFVWMPELRWRIGYPLLLLLMAGVSFSIFLWFRHRGWLRRPGG
jgi:magnesium transporter